MLTKKQIGVKEKKHFLQENEEKGKRSLVYGHRELKLYSITRMQKFLLPLKYEKSRKEMQKLKLKCLKCQPNESPQCEIMRKINGNQLGALFTFCLQT